MTQRDNRFLRRSFTYKDAQGRPILRNEYTVLSQREEEERRPHQRRDLPYDPAYDFMAEVSTIKPLSAREQSDLARKFNRAYEEEFGRYVAKSLPPEEHQRYYENSGEGSDLYRSFVEGTINTRGHEDLKRYRDSIVNANLQLIPYMIRPFVGRGIPTEDLVQTAAETLVRESMRWEPIDRQGNERNWTPSVYFASRVRNELSAMVRGEAATSSMINDIDIQDFDESMGGIANVRTTPLADAPHWREYAQYLPSHIRDTFFDVGSRVDEYKRRGEPVPEKLQAFLDEMTARARMAGGPMGQFVPNQISINEMRTYRDDDRLRELRSQGIAKFGRQVYVDPTMGGAGRINEPANPAAQFTETSNPKLTGVIPRDEVGRLGMFIKQYGAFRNPYYYGVEGRRAQAIAGSNAPFSDVMSNITRESAGVEPLPQVEGKPPKVISLLFDKRSRELTAVRIKTEEGIIKRPVSEIMDYANARAFPHRFYSTLLSTQRSWLESGQAWKVHATKRVFGIAPAGGGAQGQSIDDINAALASASGESPVGMRRSRSESITSRILGGEAPISAVGGNKGYASLSDDERSDVNLAIAQRFTEKIKPGQSVDDVLSGVILPGNSKDSVREILSDLVGDPMAGPIPGDMPKKEDVLSMSGAELGASGGAGSGKPPTVGGPPRRPPPPANIPPGGREFWEQYPYRPMESRGFEYKKALKVGESAIPHMVGLEVGTMGMRSLGLSITKTATQYEDVKSDYESSGILGRILNYPKFRRVQSELIGQMKEYVDAIRPTVAALKVQDQVLSEMNKEQRRYTERLRYRYQYARGERESLEADGAATEDIRKARLTENARRREYNVAWHMARNIELQRGETRVEQAKLRASESQARALIKEGGARGQLGQFMSRLSQPGWTAFKLRQIGWYTITPLERLASEYAASQLSSQQAAYYLGGGQGLTGAPSDILSASAGMAEFRVGMGRGVWRTFQPIVSAVGGGGEGLGNLASVVTPGVVGLGAGLGAQVLGFTAAAPYVGVGAALVTAGMWGMGQMRASDEDLARARGTQREMGVRMRMAAPDVFYKTQDSTIPFVGTASRALGQAAVGLIGLGVEKLGVTEDTWGGRWTPRDSIIPWSKYSDKEPPERAMTIVRMDAKIKELHLDQDIGSAEKARSVLAAVGSATGLGIGDLETGKYDKLLTNLAYRQGVLGVPAGQYLSQLGGIASSLGFSPANQGYAGAMDAYSNLSDLSLAQLSGSLQLAGKYNIPSSMRLDFARVRRLMSAPTDQGGLGLMGAQTDRMLNYAFSMNPYIYSIREQRAGRSGLYDIDEQNATIYRQGALATREAQSVFSAGQRAYTLEGLNIQGGRIDWGWGNTQAMWGVQDQMTSASRSYQMASIDISAQMLGLQRQMFERRSQFQLQQQGEARSMALTQRGWTREDWGLNEQVSGLQYSWQREDLQRAIRYSTGTNRRQLQRRVERLDTMFGIQTEQRDTQKERQEELWQFEDRRYREGRKFNQEMLDSQRKMFDLQQRRISMQRAQLQTMWGLEDKLKSLQREGQKKSVEWQKEDIERQKKYYEEVLWPYQDKTKKLTQDAEDAYAKYLGMQVAAMAPGGALHDAWIKYVKDMVKALEDAVKGVGGTPTVNSADAEKWVSDYVNRVNRVRIAPGRHYFEP